MLKSCRANMDVGAVRVHPFSLSRVIAILSAAIISLSAFKVSGQDLMGPHPYIKAEIIFGGDLMGHGMQIAAAKDETTGTYSYQRVFRHIAPILMSHDAAVANLEVTLAGAPYTGYPLFSSPVAFAEAARDAGIGVLTTANNHAVDRGLQGIRSTIKSLDSLSVKHTGTYSDAADRAARVPLVVEAGGLSLALLSYTYGTNGIPVPEPAVVNLIYRELIAADIERAKKMECDAIVAFMHWGREYDTMPSPFQKELAEWLFAEGADIIIGSHPHVIQPVEHIRSAGSGRDRLVAYSLGNLVSNQRWRRTDGGMLLSIRLSVYGDQLIIERAGYILTWVHTPLSSRGRREFEIVPAAHFEKHFELIGDSSQYNQMRLFINDSRRFMGSNAKSIDELRGERLEMILPCR